MADTVKQISIKQAGGTYVTKDIGVDSSNVSGLSADLAKKQNLLEQGDNITLETSLLDPNKVRISATDTTYENKTAASGGTDVSLVTTGDKYNWNNKVSTSELNTGLATKQNLLEQGDNISLEPSPTDPGKVRISATSGTTYESLPAAEGGTDLSLVTTGEKYDWNHIADGKANVATTLAGYGITNAYTKTETNTEISNYAPSKNNVYTKSETYSKSETYTKAEVDNAIKNGTLTISQNGTVLGYFTANQSDSTPISILTDVWVNSSPVLVDANYQVTFDNVDDSYAYELYFDHTGTGAVPQTGITSIEKQTGTTSGVKIIYTTYGTTPNSTACYLRQLR